ncbi:MAG: arginase family protein [Candidatus Thalassarchaeaceae archaeon]|jgi:agmatinase|nr:arginase family protein [Candidatus Thalassarchaeaceae archaeon]|tara:strand:- start:745 stop:1680 length:936 start_codon:yes stop_codon:yes gene_type:complete
MEEAGEGNFLGLEEQSVGPWDVVIMPIPYEMTTSWVEGTERGPKACIEASSQVELYDPILPLDLPCGMSFHTAEEWSSDAGTLKGQLESIREYVQPRIGGSFPLILGGEHGILPPIVEAISTHPLLEGDLGGLTIVQIDAHADLRDELNGERYSHGTALRRSLDLGVGKVIQIGTRALSREEAEFSESDQRVETWFARDFMGVCDGEAGWSRLTERLGLIEGAIWITFDVDGLDGSLVPATGTPVPGGISHWAAVEIIERVFSAPNSVVIGADVNEIVPGKDSPLTEFNAALIATKVVACHIANLTSGKGE